MTRTHRRRRIALLGNGAYTTMVSSAGSGVSRHGDIAVNRWRNDGTRDNYGQWCYVNDLTLGQVWSAGTSRFALPHRHMWSR